MKAGAWLWLALCFGLSEHSMAAMLCIIAYFWSDD